MNKTRKKHSTEKKESYDGIAQQRWLEKGMKKGIWGLQGEGEDWHRFSRIIGREGKNVRKGGEGTLKGERNLSRLWLTLPVQRFIGTSSWGGGKKKGTRRAICMVNWRLCSRKQAQLKGVGGKLRKLVIDCSHIHKRGGESPLDSREEAKRR